MRESMDIQQIIEELSKSYTPEWRFTKEHPDAGSVTAILIGKMLQGCADRLGLALHKHKIQFLNLFDGFVPEPIESAKSIVCFQPVSGMDSVIPIPKGTRLTANAESGQVFFETAHSITAADTQLVTVISCDKQHDSIVRLLERTGTDDSIQKVNFDAFDGRGENESEHVLTLFFENVFNALNQVDFSLIFSLPSQEELDSATELFRSDDISFFVACQSKRELLQKVEIESGRIHLKNESCSPAKIPFGANREGFQVDIRTSYPVPLSIPSIRLSFSEESLLPDYILCQGAEQNPGHFFPFGFPMEIYSECGIESERVFSKKGAKVTITFDLNFQTIHQKIPELEQQMDYKIVMKKPVSAPKQQDEEVHADVVLLEYRSAVGWRLLIKDEQAKYLFNGSVNGLTQIVFLCPEDIVDLEDAAGEPRIRLRLWKAANLYRTPSIQYCPEIMDLHLSYTYEESPRLPDAAFTSNNFETHEITERFLKEQGTTLFFSNLPEQRTMYLGFEGVPQGAPLSIYWALDNHSGEPIPFSAEYSTPNGFLPAQISDGTSGMLYSGITSLHIPQNVTKKELFGRNCYWIRLLAQNREICSESLPKITGIYLNSAEVENVNTQTEYFYAETPDAPLRIQLSSTNILQLSVYVNEEGGANSTNWIEWRPAERMNSLPDLLKREFTVDYANGLIIFAKNSFASYPIRMDGPTVKVVFKSYQGTTANVGIGEINAFMDAVPYIRAVSNPLPACGGQDGYNEESATEMAASLLRTRGRAVSEQDYFYMIRQISYGVNRIRCRSGVHPSGAIEKNAITIALLMNEYEKGGHIFLAAKEKIYRYLIDNSPISAIGKKLYLIPPYFIEISIRLWAQSNSNSYSYELQRKISDTLRQFIDPLTGGFGGLGWEIGLLPTVTQILAYIKIRHPDISVSRMTVTAKANGHEYEIRNEIHSETDSPFALAVNGEHTVYLEMGVSG